MRSGVAGTATGQCWVESEVLLDILQDLAARRIPALGLHDGLLVAVSDKEAMRRVAKAVTGIDLPVSEK